LELNLIQSKGQFGTHTLFLDESYDNHQLAPEKVKDRRTLFALWAISHQRFGWRVKLSIA